MKRLSILVVGLFSLMSLQAQEQGLVIVYNQQTKMDIDKELAVKDKEYATLMEEAIERIDQNELTINDKQAISKPIEKINNEQYDGDTRAWIILNSTTPIFMDLEEQKVYQVKNNIGKTYEIVDSLKQYDWQLTREKKKVLGFDCKKAVTKDGEKEIIAWYAPKLPYRVGPDAYTGVPGTILELEIHYNNKSNRISHYWADDVQVKDDLVMDFPKFKNLMTYEEYKVQSKKDMKAFRESMNQGIERD